MCGICGKYYFSVHKQARRELLDKMTISLESRGPDEQGVFVCHNIGLGVRRLSIIDIQGGRQPVFNENEKISAVFNGEIYNYLPLKERLIKKGHVIKTKCDSEIIPHLYEEFGVSLFNELEGMFALAIFDSLKNELVIGRDRFGIKPVYFFCSADSLAFSSSLASLLVDPDVPRELDHRGINSYFTYNYFPDELTPFARIKKLLPGHLLLCSERKTQVTRYWELPVKEAGAVTVASYARQFSRLLQEVVESHLSGEVPMGVFLSGGIDSSALAYYAKKIKSDISTFTIGFEDPTFDERKFSSLIASALGTRHHEMVIKEDIPALVAEAVRALDIPLGEASFLPTLKISEFARKTSGVVLSGEGADELFGGYQTYQADALAQLYRRLPGFLRKKIIPGAFRLIPYDNSRMGARFKAELFLKGANSFLNSHYCWREVFSAEEKKQLFSKDLYRMLEQDDRLKEPYDMFLSRFAGSGARQFTEKALYYDSTSWLSFSILPRLDMASMHHSLEARVPYLDRRVVEFASGLPVSCKVSLWQTKPFLRRAFKGILPDDVLRRPKHGFSVPIARWFRSELKEYFLALIRGVSPETGFFVNSAFLEELFDEHAGKKADHSRKLWNAMIFILWMESMDKRT